MKLLFYKLLLFSPILLGIAATNYIIDPANIFGFHQTDNDSIPYEQSIVNYLMKGYNVTNLENYDERLFQKKFIQTLKSSPEIVILGSSRSQLIGNDLFKNKMIINNSVTGPSIEDYLAIYNLYDKRSFKPQLLLIELPPWLLNDNNEQTRWESLKNDYDQMIHKLDVEPLVNNSINIHPQYFELFSFEYFQQSLKEFYNKKKSDKSKFLKSDFKEKYSLKSFYTQLEAEGYKMEQEQNDTLIFFNSILQIPDFYTAWLKKHGDVNLTEDDRNLVFETKQYRILPFSKLSEIKQENISKLNRRLLEATFYETCPTSTQTSSYPTLEINNSGLTRLVDGTISYPQSYRNQTSEEIQIAAKSYISTHPVFGLKDFNHISEKSLLFLSKFIDYLKKSKIKTTFVLMPYHPMVYSYFSSNQEYYKVLEAEFIYRNLAKKKNITILGSYDPSNQNIDSSYFYDGMHLKKSGLTKIINSTN